MGGKALDSVCSWLQESPTTALIRPVSLNGCDPYDFSEFPRRIVGMFLEDLDNPLPTFLLFLPTFYDFSYYFLVAHIHL